jgi:hypothetical protein
MDAEESLPRWLLRAEEAPGDCVGDLWIGHLKRML